MPKPLRRFLHVTYLVWFLTFVLGWIERSLLNLPEQNWYPFFPSQARFTDFTIFQERFRYFHQAQFFDLPGFPFTYPAPVAVFLESFYLFGVHALSAFVVFCCFAFVGAGIALGLALRRRGLALANILVFIGTSVVLSYPFWFLVDRGNVEIADWFLLALGITAYWHKKWYLASVLFGVAISFKIFPFVFLGLLLSARKYKAVLLGLFICVFTTIASTFIVGPTYKVASNGIASGLNFFRTHYVLQVHKMEIGFDHSAFAIIKELTFRPHTAQGPLYTPWFYGYMAVAAIAGLIIYQLRIRTLPRANQILALTVASILLPPVSGDYTLVHLYIPWAALVLVSVSLKNVNGLQGRTLSFICMAFLMAPESLVFVHGLRVAGQLKAIVLLLLFIIALVCPFEEPESCRDEHSIAGVA